jgi:hypothetical protein
VITRAYLLAIGALSLVIGLAFMLRPAETMAMVELAPSTSTAIIEVQGFYGGQMCGLGAAVLWCVRRRWHVAGLLLAAAPLAGTALGRLYGVLESGECPPVIAALMAVELATAAAGLVLLRRERPAPDGRR